MSSRGSRSLLRAALLGRPALVVGLAVVAATPTALAAQEAPEAETGGLAEIVVTAQRREENLQDVPISVSAISAETLEGSGIANTLSLPQVVPSVQMTRSGPSNIFFIRGIGNSSGGTGEEGANAFYIDDIYLADLAQANTEFNNIQRIEVLKGPQGTLFGRNSSGGLVNVITKEPGQEFELDGKVGIGNYQTRKAQVYVAGPLSSNVAMDLALTGRKQSNGYGVNVQTGEETGKGWFWGARSKAVFEPSETFKLTLGGDYWKSKDDYSNGFTIVEGALGLNPTGGPPFPFVGDYNINTTNPVEAILEVWGVSARAELDLEFGSLTSITALRNLDSISNVDSDYIPLVLAELYIPSKSRSFQQELRLASPGDGPLNWQIGAFFFRSRAGVFNQELRGPGGPTSGNNLTSIMKTRSYAGFGEVYWDISDTTHLTLGGRYTKESRRLNAVQFPVTNGVVSTTQSPGFPRTDKISFNKFTYRIALRQDLSEDVNVYVSHSRGFKSGLWALQSPLGPSVKPQTTDAYEIGLKSELFDRLLRVNLAAYHYKIDDYQIRAAPNAATPILLNAATVKVDGIEGEVQLAPAEGLLISGNFNLLKSRFSNFPGAIFNFPRPGSCATGGPTGPLTGGNITNCIRDASGNRTPLSPKFTAALGISYTAPLGEVSELRFNANYSHNSGYFFEQDNRLRQPSFQLLNASVEYKITENWGVELWGNNILDERYFTTKLGSGTGDHGELRPPMTYGVNVTFDY